MTESFYGIFRYYDGGGSAFLAGCKTPESVHEYLLRNKYSDYLIFSYRAEAEIRGISCIVIEKILLFFLRFILCIP